MVYWKVMEIKQLRERLGLTQEQLAHQLGVTVKTVNRWERGRSKPSPMARRLLIDLNRRKGDLANG